MHFSPTIFDPVFHPRLVQCPAYNSIVPWNAFTGSIQVDHTLNATFGMDEHEVCVWLGTLKIMSIPIPIHIQLMSSVDTNRTNERVATNERNKRETLVVCVQSSNVILWIVSEQHAEAVKLTCITHWLMVVYLESIRICVSFIPFDSNFSIEKCRTADGVRMVCTAILL